MTHHSIFSTAHPNRLWKSSRRRWLVMGFTLGLLGGCLVMTKRAAASCVGGDVIDLIDPVVTVVAGPGDPVAETALWSTFDYLLLIGPDEFHIDATTATLERSP